MPEIPEEVVAAIVEKVVESVSSKTAESDSVPTAGLININTIANLIVLPAFYWVYRTFKDFRDTMVQVNLHLSKLVAEGQSSQAVIGDVSDRLKHNTAMWKWLVEMMRSRQAEMLLPTPEDPT